MIKCPLCKNAYNEIEDLYLHIDKHHEELIPEGWTTSQYVYYLKTKKDHGNCVMCKKPTDWNEQTNKYHRFCNDPKCKEKYREVFKERMISKHGKVTLLDDPEHQKMMLSHRSISGVYTWTNGEQTTYTGSYELDFLKMLDTLFNFDPKDIMAPSPHTYWYEYDGTRRFYIPDFYIPSLNLEIEIKDGGNNPNNHYKIQEVDKVKEKLKDKVMLSQKKVSYIKVVNKEYGVFFEFLNKAKENFINGIKEKPIFILENTEEHTIHNDTDIVLEGTNPKYNEEDLKDHHGIAAVIVNEKGQILIMDHVKLNKLTIPVGKVKHDQTVEEGLIQELQEELDITPTVYHEMFSTNNKYIRNGLPVMVNQHVFFISKYKGKIKNNEPEKHRSLTWMNIEDLRKEDHLTDATKNYLKYIETNETKEDNQLIPVFVLLTYTDSAMAKIIKTVTHQPYSHAGISLDSSLTHVFSFGRKNENDKCKFVDESIYDGLLGSVRNNTPFSLYVALFKPSKFKKLKDKLTEIKNNIHLHSYNYMGLINFALGKESHNEKMFCSQFVAEIINAGDSSRLKRHSSLYSPSDLSKIKGMHFVTRGILGNYNQNKVDTIVKSIINNTTKDEIFDTSLESFLGPIEGQDNITITKCKSCGGPITLDNIENMSKPCMRCGQLYYADKDKDSLVLKYESGSPIDFIEELETIDDVQRLKDCVKDISDSSYRNKIKKRIASLESCTYNLNKKYLYIIIESTRNRLLNNKLGILNSNDKDTAIYLVEANTNNKGTELSVDKYKRQNETLVSENCPNRLPEVSENNVQICYKVSSDDCEVLNTIKQRFSQAIIWKPMGMITMLDLSDLIGTDEYFENILKSINIDLSNVKLEKIG